MILKSQVKDLEQKICLCNKNNVPANQICFILEVCFGPRLPFIMVCFLISLLKVFCYIDRSEEEPQVCEAKPRALRRRICFINNCAVPSTQVTLLVS